MMNAGQNKKYIGTIRCVLTTLLLLVAATGIGWLFRFLGFPEANIVIVYLLSILLISRMTSGFIYGISASFIATFAFNYFFTEPYYTLHVNNPTYFITFIIMVTTALITSALTSRVKQNAIIALEKEAEASALYQLTNHLTDAKDISDIGSITVKTISEILDCRTGFLSFDADGVPEQTFIQQKSLDEQIRRNVEDRGALKHRIDNLRTPYDVGVEFSDWPIYGHDTILGIIRIPKEYTEQLNEAQMRLLHSMIESVALAMDRFRSAQERIKSREETTQERYRANLLRAISHDLRTPLSGIMGTSEMLMDMTDKADNRYSLAEGIYKDADWLHSLVENILSLTRLQDGKLTLNKQMEAVEEVVGVAISVIGKRAPEYEIAVQIPDKLLLVPMDAKLIDQALVNLLDNAVKHTPSQNEISVTVSEDTETDYVVFSVKDGGMGIADTDLPNVFKLFYTTHGKDSDAHRGVGLGLSICESIVKAHGGTIFVQNRQDGSGAEFIFTLPMEDKKNAE